MRETGRCHASLCRSHSLAGLCIQSAAKSKCLSFSSFSVQQTHADVANFVFFKIKLSNFKQDYSRSGVNKT